MKGTNYMKHKERLLELISKSAICFDCLARELCRKLCSDGNIDPCKSPAPCTEAWKQWADSVE